MLTLSVANTYSGGTAIGSGATTKLGNASAIGKNDLFLNGTLDLGGFSPTINGLAGAGAVDNTSGTNTTTNLSDPNGLWSITVPKNTTGQLFYRSKATNVCP